jgi:hypothetical protein
VLPPSRCRLSLCSPHVARRLQVPVACRLIGVFSHVRGLQTFKFQSVLAILWKTNDGSRYVRCTCATKRSWGRGGLVKSATSGASGRRSTPSNLARISLRHPGGGGGSIAPMGSLEHGSPKRRTTSSKVNVISPQGK